MSKSRLGIVAQLICIGCNSCVVAVVAVMDMYVTLIQVITDASDINI